MLAQYNHLSAGDWLSGIKFFAARHLQEDNWNRPSEVNNSTRIGVLVFVYLRFEMVHD